LIRNSRHGQHLHAFRACTLQCARNFIHGRARGVHVIDDDDRPANMSAHLKRARQIPFSLAAAEAGLARRVLPAAKQSCRQVPAQPARDQLRLVKATLPFAPAVQRDRYDQVTGERLVIEAIFQNVPQRIRERDAVRIFQMMDDLAERAGEQQGGSGKIENVFTPSTKPAKTFNRRCGLTALRAEWRF